MFFDLFLGVEHPKLVLNLYLLQPPQLNIRLVVILVVMVADG